VQQAGNERTRQAETAETATAGRRRRRETQQAENGRQVSRNGNGSKRRRRRDPGRQATAQAVQSIQTNAAPGVTAIY